jgi:hypothetical protein
MGVASKVPGTHTKAPLMTVMALILAEPILLAARCKRTAATRAAGFLASPGLGSRRHAQPIRPIDGGKRGKFSRSDFSLPLIEEPSSH